MPLETDVLGAFAERSATAMALLDREGWRLREANPAFRRLLGEPAACPAPGRPLAALLAGEGMARCLALLEEAQGSGAVAAARALPLGAAGATRLWDVEAHPAAGGAGAVLLVAHEVTAHLAPRQEAAAAQAALARSAEQMRLAIGTARMFFWDWDLGSDRIAWSDGLEAACGLPEGGFDGSIAAFRALLHPEDLPRVEAALARALAGEAPYDLEFRMRRGDGGLRWVAARGTVLRDAAGRPERFIGIDLDITARRAEEEALRQSEARLRLAEETAGFGHWEWDARTDTQAWSPQQYRLHGLDPRGPAPRLRDWIAMVHAEDRARLAEAAGQGFRDAERRYAITFRIRRADDGEQRWMLSIARIQEADAAGRPLRLSGINLDVTEQIEMRSELRRTEALLKAIGECTTDAIYAKDEESRLLFANPATLAILGRPLDEVIGRRLEEWHPRPEQAQALRDNDLRILGRGTAEVVEEVFDTPGRGTRVYRSAKAPLRDAGGRTIGVVGVSSDITAQKRAETGLRDSITAFETLVKEADHRIKNSLQLVASLLRLQAGRASSPEAAAALHAAMARVLAVGHVHRTLYLSRDLRTVDLCQVLRDLAAQSGAAEAGSPRVRCDVPAALPLDAERAIPLGLMVNELLANALKHAYPRERPAGEVRIALRERPEGIEVVVADDGVGLPLGRRPRGLGGSVLEALARQIGARLAVESAAGRGTTARLTLPRLRGPEAASPADEAQAVR